MIIIKSADATNPADLDRLADVIAGFLDRHTGASVEWHQSAAATSTFSSHRLTGIVKWYTPKSPGDAS